MKGMPKEDEKTLLAAKGRRARKESKSRPDMFNVGIDVMLIIMVNYDLFYLDPHLETLKLYHRSASFYIFQKFFHFNAKICP